MKRILSTVLFAISMLIAGQAYAHCGRCTESTCDYCACQMGTQKEGCDKTCTCKKDCKHCVEQECPCIKEGCKYCKATKSVKHTHEKMHHETKQEESKQ